MGERGSRKIPVTEREFLWVQDDDKGEVVLHVGPTMVSPTAADRIVIDDGLGGFKESTTGRPQRMVELSDSQYAVLFNPLLEPEDGVNGRFKSGRNESRPLKNGTRHMIPGPCSFWLRPGQRIEVRDAHELASNQYLVVKVYGEVDIDAPYYTITAKSAAITTSTAEDATGNTSSTSIEDVDPVDLHRGQLVVIRGLDTQFYIPPTGVDVVPDLSIDSSGAKLTAEAARKLLHSMPLGQASAAPAAAAQAMALEDEAEFEDLVEESNVDIVGPNEATKEAKQYAQRPVEQSARFRNQVRRKVPAPKKVSPPAVRNLTSNTLQQLLSSDMHRQALEREVRKARLIRQAVVLGEKEYCVILDADGKKQINVGPARVFPGPYDSFMTQGSNNRLYNAYELLPQRGLWLRFIAPITREKLAAKLPRGVELDKEAYFPGDELILTGVNSFFFPFNAIEVLHPHTGQPYVGNDHSDIFVEAIGIDQKSGIYVRDLETGEVRLVRGKQSYLVDPRKEVHITRSIPARDWNLWIAQEEPHKTTSETITTPWALSIVVPHNTAVMATSANGQRVIEGPCVELLEYEETLVTLSLSTGTPKSDSALLETCFMRTKGNRVSDGIRAETSDFVEIDIRVSYRVTFDPETKSRWFNHINYIQVLSEHLRSIVRSRCRQFNLTELWPQLPAVIRDTVLGERTEDGRKGRLFDENGMRVTEVEVLSAEILDQDIGELLGTVQKESVALQINNRQLREQLASEQLKAQLNAQRATLQEEAAKRDAALSTLIAQLKHAASLNAVENKSAIERQTAELEARRLEEQLAAELKRNLLSTDARLEQLSKEVEGKVAADKLHNAETIAHQTALKELEIRLIETKSQATVAEREAVQEGLIEALTAAGDKLLLSEVAQNMNLISLFRGQQIGDILADVVGGTPVQRTIDALSTQKTAQE